MFTATNTYIKRKERSQISNLTLHLKELDKVAEQTSPKLVEEKRNNKGQRKNK